MHRRLGLLGGIGALCVLALGVRAVPAGGAAAAKRPIRNASVRTVRTAFVPDSIPDGDPTTIPYVYAHFDSFLALGMPIRMMAFTTNDSANLLIDVYATYQLRQPMPPQSLMQQVSGFISPSDQNGAWIVAYGTVGVDSLASSDENLTFSLLQYEVILPAEPLPPSALESRGQAKPGNPGIQADDPCRLAMLLSGGIDRKGNRPEFWKDLADFYKFERSQKGNYPAGNIGVLYFEGTRRRDDIPADAVQRATLANIQGYLQGPLVRKALKDCEGKGSRLQIAVSNHGLPGDMNTPRGSICLLGTNSITPRQLRDLLQDVVDRKLGNLEVYLGTCYGGAVVNELRALDPGKGDANILLASSTDANHVAVSSEEDTGMPWMSRVSTELTNGKEPARALLAASLTNDDYQRRFVQQARKEAADLLQAAKGEPDADKRKKALTLVVLARMLADDVQGAIGGEQYFHSLVLPQSAQSQIVQVTPGGKLNFAFSGDPAACGNTLLHRIDVQGNKETETKVAEWNWTVPNSAEFKPGNDQRSFSAPKDGSGLFYVVSRSAKPFRVAVQAVNPRAAKVLQDSTSNPQDFAGFLMGRSDSSSAEFGAISSPAMVVRDSLGLNLQSLPQVLGAGGVQALQVQFVVLEQNVWWSDMGVWLKLLSASPGRLQVQCTNADSLTGFLNISSSGEHELRLGGIHGTGLHTLTLTAITGSFQLDCWELRSHVSTGAPVPVVVSDLQASSTREGILLRWCLAADTRQHLGGIHVQRAEESSGPYVDRAVLPPDAALFADEQVRSSATFWYRLELVSRQGDVSLAGPISISAPGSILGRTALQPPVESSDGAILLRYRIGAGAPRNVALEIYDVTGRLVRVVERSRSAPGEFVRSWDRRDANGTRSARGVYLVRLHTPDASATRKLVLSRN